MDVFFEIDEHWNSRVEKEDIAIVRFVEIVVCSMKTIWTGHVFRVKVVNKKKVSIKTNLRKVCC